MIALLMLQAAICATTSSNLQKGDHVLEARQAGRNTARLVHGKHMTTFQAWKVSRAAKLEYAKQLQEFKKAFKESYKLEMQVLRSGVRSGQQTPEQPAPVPAS